LLSLNEQAVSVSCRDDVKAATVVLLLDAGCIVFMAVHTIRKLLLSVCHNYSRRGCVHLTTRFVRVVKFLGDIECIRRRLLWRGGSRPRPHTWVVVVVVVVVAVVVVVVVVVVTKTRGLGFCHK